MPNTRVLAAALCVFVGCALMGCVTGESLGPGGSGAYLVPPSSRPADPATASPRGADSLDVAGDLPAVWSAALAELDARRLGTYSIAVAGGAHVLKGPRVHLRATRPGAGVTRLELRLFDVPGGGATPSPEQVRLLDAIAARVAAP